MTEQPTKEQIIRRIQFKQVQICLNCKTEYKLGEPSQDTYGCLKCRSKTDMELIPLTTLQIIGGPGEVAEVISFLSKDRSLEPDQFEKLRLEVMHTQELLYELVRAILEIDDDGDGEPDSEPVNRREISFDDEENDGTDSVDVPKQSDGKVPCPECGDKYTEKGLPIHIGRIHKDRKTPPVNKEPKQSPEESENDNSDDAIESWIQAQDEQYHDLLHDKALNEKMDLPSLQQYLSDLPELDQENEIDPTAQEVLALILENEEIDPDDLEEMSDLASSEIAAAIHQLLDLNVIERHTTTVGPGVYYTPVVS